VPSLAPSLLKRTENWTTLSSPPPLLRGEVHFWRVLVPETEGIPAHWAGLLTAEERASAARKRIPLDARRTLTSRACLRLLLARYLAVRPDAIAFTANATGKPRIAAPAVAPTLEFNVSHSGAWVVFAFARGLPLGVDVECHRELEFSELVNSFFSPEERATWATIPSADHLGAFFSAWTRKEAYLKAIGVGLSKSLDSFTIAFDSGPTSELIWCASDASAPQRWVIASIDLAPDHACALAVPSAVTALHAFTFDTEPPSGRRSSV
jgi:4'-phosphopantetheinyl transferase